MKDKVLEITDLKVRYVTDDGVVEALNGISFSIEKGDVLGLVGETGAGKTTTAYSVLQLIPKPPGEIVSGQINFMGEDLLKLSNKEMRKIRGDRISMIFQDPMSSLNPVMTAGEQILEVIRLHDKISHADAVRKAQDILEIVGISSTRFNDYPHQFSGGMKQRVVIAIALACSPQLLIADEPTTALDVTIQAQVLDTMKKLNKDFDTSMLMITHDLGVVAQICDKVAVIYAGEIVEYGTLDDIFNHTKHPYTKGLFNSLPGVNKTSNRLNPIEGLMPDPTNLPSGCNFHPRCKNATTQCSSQCPDNIEVRPGHFVRCLLYDNASEEMI